MTALLPTYPAGFDNAAWQKRKGTIAKIATSGDGTGLGKKLDLLKAAFNKVDWDKFVVSKVLSSVSRADLRDDHVKQFIASCNAEIPKTADARKLASQVQDDAKALSVDWGKSKLIPKSSTAAATEIADKAKGLVYAMAPATLGEYMKQEVAELQKEIAKQAVNYNMSADKVMKLVAGILSKAPKLKAPAEWSDFWREEVRGLGTAIPYVAAGNPKLKPHGKKFKEIVSNQSNPANEDELKERVDEIVKVAKIVKACMP